MAMHIHLDCPFIRSHGSYCNSSPVKYALNSGLFSEGSSHGVSAYQLCFLLVSLDDRCHTSPESCAGSRLTTDKQSVQHHAHTPNINGLGRISGTARSTELHVS